MTTLLNEQLLAKFLSSLRSSEYKVYSQTIAPSGTFSCDIGDDVKTKFGTPYRVPATNGWLVADAKVFIKFNDEADEIEFDPTLFGNIWTYTRGELLVDKIILENKGATGVYVQIFAAGAKDIQFPQ